ncbi:uncharacterized protein LOC5577063 isoform X1 [Aedes aegypti]|uniref:Uncharacterized protein n=1 Tax=Aedes aegypti TaxID=7159 RepID=A0A1S4F3P2_AEDAE|nr:uncharacterized protein LOC5577063 isoform X1 [Aedes aegypti]
MEIIPMMVVLICASSAPWWEASALELRIPGLGKINVDFVTDSPAVGDDSAMGDQTKGQGTAENPGESVTTGNEEVTTKKADATTDESEEKPMTEAANEEVAAALTKNPKAKKSNAKQSKTTPKKESEATTEKIQATTQAQTTEKKEVDKSSSEKGKEVTTEPSESEKQPSTAQPEQTPDPASEEKQTTKAANEEVTEAPKLKPTKAAKQKKTKATKAIHSKTTPMKPNEATTEKAKATTQAPTTEKPTEQSPETSPDDATTEAAEGDDDGDDFDMDDIWDDVEDPPEEFGRQYDLDPKLLDSGNGLGDFQPKLELPPDMTKDMFYEEQADAIDPNDDPDEKGGFFDRLRKFFSIGNLIEQLDTIPGKIQSLMDQLRQKKSDGLKKLREKLDKSSETVGSKISEAFAKLKPSKQRPPQQCLESIQKKFQHYEAALQQAVEPCFEKARSVMEKQEGALAKAVGRFNQMLTDMQSCAQKLEGGPIKTLVKSILNMGTCTKNNIKSQIGQALQPQMERLSELIQRQGSAMQGNMNATGVCVERKLQIPKFQKRWQDLVTDGKRCLERSRE